CARGHYTGSLSFDYW
nr:immunoglobulin heavy chain junction region [Macaca mulatta]